MGEYECEYIVEKQMALCPQEYNLSLYISLSQKLLSFYKDIIDAQYFLFYIILLDYVWSILF